MTVFPGLRKQRFPAPRADTQPQTIKDAGCLTDLFKQSPLYLSYFLRQTLEPWSPNPMTNLLSSEKMTSCQSFTLHLEYLPSPFQTLRFLFQVKKRFCWWYATLETQRPQSTISGSPQKSRFPYCPAISWSETWPIRTDFWPLVAGDSGHLPPM